MKKTCLVLLGLLWFKGENETYIEALVENGGSVLYDK